jgi:hypothetical protein
MTARRHAAWRRSAYEAAGAVARPGRRSAAVDALLARLGAAQGGFVTAWNPYSRRRPAGWNARMQARLVLAARRWPAAAGRGGDGGWWEEHLLVAADPRCLGVLGRRFRQAAIVLVRRGAPARLRVLHG